MQIDDIKRSFYQFKKHQEVKYLNLTYIHKFILSLLWVLLLPTVLFKFFLKKDKYLNKIFVLDYTDTEPYHTIYNRLKKDTNYTFIALDKFYIPILPWILVKDTGSLLWKEPLFFIKNLDFLGALAYKVSKYNYTIQKYGIANLIVLQEYSFYSSYLTRMLEYENGKLYNIQHGIPGETYSYFRFTKCFVWGDYYRQVYIQNKAEESQLIVAGSVFHDSIKSLLVEEAEFIDILYVMQGYVGGEQETIDILNLFKILSVDYTVRVLQHPRHPIKIPRDLVEFEGTIVEAISRSNVIISRYSTAMLDALYLGKYSFAFVGKKTYLKQYVEYLPNEMIIENITDLEEQIIKKLDEKRDARLESKYINKEKNAIKVIDDEICQHIICID